MRERESHIIERQKTAMMVQTHSPTTRTRREDGPGPKSSLPAAHYSASLVSSLLAASSLLTNLPREAPRLLVRQRSDKCEATTARPTAPPPSYVHASANPPPQAPLRYQTSEVYAHSTQNQRPHLSPWLPLGLLIRSHIFSGLNSKILFWFR